MASSTASAMASTASTLRGSGSASCAASATACSAPPGEFVPQARDLGAGLVRAYLYWAQVEPEPGHYRWDDGGRPARAAGRRRGALDHRVLELAVGHPPADRLPAAVARPRPARVRRVRPPAGPALRRAGAVLAVRQRAEQHRPALGGHRGRVRRAAADHVPRGQGGRPGRGGGARRLRLRRVQQRAGQRAPAVLRPRRRAPAATPSTCSACTSTAISPACPTTWPPPGSSCGRTGTSSRSSWASTPARSRSSSPRPWRSCRRRSRPPSPDATAAAQSTDELVAERRPGHPGTPGDDRPVRPDGQPSAPAADVHGGLPGRNWRPSVSASTAARWSCAPAGPGRGRAPDRVLEPRARIPGACRSPPDDAPADRQAPAARLPGRRAQPSASPRRTPSPCSPEQLAGARTVSRVTRRRPARPARVRGRPRRARAAARALGPPRPLRRRRRAPVTAPGRGPRPAATVTDAFGRTWTARRQDGQLRLPVSVTPLFVEAPVRSQAGRDR